MTHWMIEPQTHTQKARPHHARPETDKGAVLLMTLLVMSVMAALAVTLMDDVRHALRRTANVQAYAQADWYVSGAQDFAKNYLETLLSRTDPALLNAALLTAEPVSFPIDGGVITLAVQNGSQCVSLGGLTGNNGRRLFRQLLETRGWPSLVAANFTSVAADWVDADSVNLPGGAEDGPYLRLTPAYRTANAVMESSAELRALSGMSEDKFQALRPFVCAREDAATQINIDSLALWQAPVLAAVMGGVSHIETARQLIDQRPAAGYQNLETLTASPVLEGSDISRTAFANIIFTPAHLWTELRVDYQQITRHAVIEFSVNGAAVTAGYKRFGADEKRPMVAALANALKDKT